MLALEVVFLRRWLRSLVQPRAHGAIASAPAICSTPPLEPMPSRELEHLRDAFSDMVDNLREARESIARQVEEERRMRQELESLQQQVIRQERLAAIGVLLSGIAHELNNPLQTISGFAELLQRDPDLRAGRARRPRAHPEGERARERDHPQPLALRPAAGIDAGAVYLRDVVASVIELRQRRFQEQGITLDVDEQREPAGARRVHRAAAGRC